MPTVSFDDFVEQQREDPEFARLPDEAKRRILGDEDDPGAGVPVRPRPPKLGPGDEIHGA